MGLYCIGWDGMGFGGGERVAGGDMIEARLHVKVKGSWCPVKDDARAWQLQASTARSPLAIPFAQDA